MKKKILLSIGILCYVINSTEASDYINPANSIYTTYDYICPSLHLVNQTVTYRYPVNPLAEKSMIAHKSSKHAFLAGNKYDGTFNKPDTLLYGDVLTYEIMAVNPNELNRDIIIHDTLPDGLAILTSSISNKGRFNAFNRVITWELHILPGDSTLISYKARKINGTANLIINTAHITSNEEVQQTNSTFHRGVLSKVTFISGENGTISNTSTQFIDYSLYPYSGIRVVPDPGYSFAGWSYPAYEGLNGITYPAANGISEYDKISVWGDMHYTADFETVNYYINYYLQEGNMEFLNNPASYTITSDDIILNEPFKTDYVFMGWSGSNGPTPQRNIIIPKGSTGDRYYEANWLNKNEAENLYFIAYDYKGGIASETVNPVYYQEITTDILLNSPMRPGYNFTGWTITSDKPGTETITGTRIPAGTYGNLTCIASWSLINYPIRYQDNNTAIAVLPNNYTVSDLPFSIDAIPDKPGYKFVGWTGSNGQIPELSVQVPKETSGELIYHANWAFRFAEDTIYCCELPILLESGHDGLDYEWLHPDGRSLRSEDIEADVSGRYILRTNYGSTVIADTIVVLSFFENDLTIKDISKAGNKIGKEQIYIVELNPLFKDVDCHWTFEGASPPASTGDTAKVIYHSTGRRRVRLNISIEYNQVTCSKDLTYDVEIYPPNRSFFVNQHASSGSLQAGSSWTNAFYTLQEALNKATVGDYIWVAKGIYTPDKNTSFFIETNNIEIYGGFAGSEEFLCERDLSENPTYLSGGGRSVIVNSNVTGIHWDGFTILGGTTIQGGGIFNDKASVTIANCIIRDNEAKEEGGGIYSIKSSPTLYNVVISGNNAKKGGAMYNEQTSAVLTNVTISGNQAVTGGGLYNKDNANPLIQNTIIYGNQAQMSPSIYNENANPYIGYSLIEGSNGSGTNWNALFGTDKSHNLDTNPMFRKAGFDNDGNMQAGDYKPYPSSKTIDNGNNVWIYEMTIRSDQNLFSPTDSIYTSLLHDLMGNKRIMSDYTDIGAYEYGIPDIDWEAEIPVIIPEVDGLITDPTEGEHLVKAYKDFTFTIRAKPGYNMDNLTVKTGKPAWDEKGGIEIVRNNDRSATVTILKITSSMNIMIEGVSPVANETVDHQTVWSHKNKLYIQSAEGCRLKIYTITGQLIVSKKMNNKEHTIDLEPGIYTVVLDDNSYKIIINANNQ